VTGPEVLERAHAHLARYARLVIVVLLAYVAVAGLVQASNRAFWFDEHARFLLYATPGHGEWWQARLLRDGFTLRTLAADGSRVLYEVSREAGEVVGSWEPGLLEWLAVRGTADRCYPHVKPT
jgi:hypothetical protein